MEKIKTELPSISCELVERTLGRDSYRRLCMNTLLFTNPTPERRVYWHSIPNSLRSKFSQEMQVGMSMQYFDAIQKENCNPRKEKSPEAFQREEVQVRLRSLNENFDRTHRPLFGLSLQYHFGIEELSRIFGVLQSEEEARLDGSPTSFESVETSIAICISQCLSDYPERKRSIRRILSLLREYRVVTPLLDGSPSVSLQRIHSILQDSFECSYLCKLMNILLAGHNGVTTKTITF